MNDHEAVAKTIEDSACEIACVLIEREEGRRAAPYHDSRGKVTVGVGHLCEPGEGAPFPDAAIDALFFEDRQIARNGARRFLEDHSIDIERIGAARFAVLMSMAFQLGAGGLRQFRRFGAALAAGNFERAAAEMRDSRWHRQTTARA